MPVAASVLSAMCPASAEVRNAWSMPRSASDIARRMSAVVLSAPVAAPSVTARITSRMPWRSKRCALSASSVSSCTFARMSVPSRTVSLAAALMPASDRSWGVPFAISPSRFRFDRPIL